MADGPFNEDELAVQERVGVHPGALGIRDFMPDQHRGFFAQLRYVFAATADADGWPLPTMLTGEPGFISAPSSTRLRIIADPDADDPAGSNLVEGRGFALLGLDLATRRRNRANGRIAGVAGPELLVDVMESFGNCPQYIHKRQIEAAPGRHPAEPIWTFTGLADRAAAFVSRADTFFVATAARRDLGKGGLDISHRGGPAGFVGVAGNRLTIPDFRGNNYFNTLGNILGEPRVGLLFVDFHTGDVLQLQGHAGIDWPAEDDPSTRAWNVDIDRGWWRAGAAGLSWSEL